ncbi:MAG: hypothetical protein AAF763_13785 [Pseudomonadota bacterium]
MKDNLPDRSTREERERREAALFDALGAILRLPTSESLPIAGFAAGLTAAHMADVAAMETPENAAAAREALLRLHEETRDLLQSLDETGRLPSEMLRGAS